MQHILCVSVGVAVYSVAIRLRAKPSRCEVLSKAVFQVAAKWLWDKWLRSAQGACRSINPACCKAYGL